MTAAPKDHRPGALDDIFVLDLSRVLAGPTATQLLGDFGATVIKIENPKTAGDDTRGWGPYFARNPDGSPSDLSTYFMAANRNKHSVAVDISTKDGQKIIHELAARADVIIENYKPGGLAKYGLDHETMLEAYPGVVYCSISGFGQTGPNASQPGYDLMAQGYAGIMSLTGDPEGVPTKVGVGIADVMCGMYATIGVLAALHHRNKTGQGQHIDLSLVDSTMAWLINEGTNFLTSGKAPQRRGNAHPNIVPYDAFEASDGYLLVAVGNDAQFTRFCDVIGCPDLAKDQRYKTNTNRIKHRETLIPQLRKTLKAMPKGVILEKLQSVKVPVGPIHTVPQALQSDQAKARETVVSLPAKGVSGDAVQLLANPLKFSATPVQYAKAPPRFGEDTESILQKYTSHPPKKV